MFSGISYTTFPEVELGPLILRTFGLMVGLGVVLGAWVAGKVIERAGVPREDTYSIATRMVVGGVIGARVTWVLSHLDQIDSPVDVIAVWEGGLQFSGGFVAAVIVGYPSFRKWDRRLRWQNLDGYAYGLTIGLAVGRIGCYSVGEHFGTTTDFFLGTTYKGGDTREGLEGTAFETAAELQASGIGTTFHHTALYELIYLLVLFGILTYLVHFRTDPMRPGTAIGSFCLFYGVMRFLSDFLRVNDNTVIGLTGAQYLMLALLPTAYWVLFRVRPAIEDPVAIDDSGDDAEDDPADSDVEEGGAAEPAGAEGPDADYPESDYPKLR